jgi:hypothetical protein
MKLETEEGCMHACMHVMHTYYVHAHSLATEKSSATEEKQGALTTREEAKGSRVRARSRGSQPEKKQKAENQSKKQQVIGGKYKRQGLKDELVLVVEPTSMDPGCCRALHSDFTPGQHPPPEIPLQ